MDARNVTWDLDMGVRHFINLDTPTLYYVTSAIALIVVSAAWFIPGKSLDIPFYGLDENDKDAPKKRWMRDSINLLREGYRKFQDQPFQVWTTEGNQVVLPPKLVDEVKMFRDDTLPSSLMDILQAKHTNFAGGELLRYPPNNEILPRVVKDSVTKNLPTLFPEMKEELQFGMSVELPPCNDWTAIKVSPQITSLIARISGRIFVGPSMSRDNTWLKISVTYTRDAFAAATRVRTWKSSIRWIVKYFLPEIRRMSVHNAKASSLIGKILQQRAIDEKDASYEKPRDALQGVQDALPEKKRGDIQMHTDMSLGLIAAAIHTTSALCTNVIFDLAFRPEYIELLREEATEVLKESNGHWTSESMKKLKKLDSFIKESQRHTAASSSFTRKTAKDITLSNGTFLPKNTFLFAPALAISFDTSLYPNADAFDGLRFYNLRQQSPEDENRYQLTSIGKTQVHFGVGRHACPGRWLASVEIKLILATLILQYDLKVKDGVRPKNILMQAVQFVDPTAEVLFKQRQV